VKQSYSEELYYIECLFADNNESELILRYDSSKAYIYFLFAINYNNINIIKMLFSKNKPFQISNLQNDSFFHILIKTNSNIKFIAEVTAFLKEHNISINDQNIHGNTALHLVSHNYKSVAIIEILLRSNIDVNIKNKNGRIALSELIYKQDETEEAYQKLIEAGSDIFSKDNEEKTPIHHAVIARNLPAVELLLAKTAGTSEATLEDTHGKTPIYYALQNSPEIFELLIKNEFKNGHLTANIMNKIFVDVVELPKNHLNKEKFAAVMLKYGADIQHKYRKGIIAKLASETLADDSNMQNILGAFSKRDEIIIHVKKMLNNILSRHGFILCADINYVYNSIIMDEKITKNKNLSCHNFRELITTIVSKLISQKKHDKENITEAQLTSDARIICGHYYDTEQKQDKITIDHQKNLFSTMVLRTNNCAAIITR
jgi:ankyrin repeat protein